MEQWPPFCQAAFRPSYTTSARAALVGPDGCAFGSLCICSGQPNSFDADEAELLAEMAQDLSYGVETLRARERRTEMERDLLRTNDRLEGMLLQITGTMGKVVEARDPYTQGHQVGVAKLSRQLAEEMGMSEDDVNAIEIAALVHDIGKLSVPAEILTKPGKLTPTEFALIQEHPETGHTILQAIDFGWPIAETVLQHHERLDGSGYPRGLIGEQMSMAARVVALADVIEAMAAHRPYRPALGLDAAVAEIENHPEKFDPAVIAACTRLYSAGRLDIRT